MKLDNLLANIWPILFVGFIVLDWIKISIKDSALEILNLWNIENFSGYISNDIIFYTIAHHMNHVNRRLLERIQFVNWKLFNIIIKHVGCHFTAVYENETITIIWLISEKTSVFFFMHGIFGVKKNMYTKLA